MIEWTEALSVGTDVLDDDHKIIVQCLNEFVGAVDRGEGAFLIDSVFVTLMDYTSFHFAREERVMAACAYPGLTEHRQHHQDLKAKLVEMRERYMLTPDKEFDDELREFLETWLKVHICHEDFAYRPSLDGKAKTIARAAAGPQ